MLRILLGAVASCVILVAAWAGQAELPHAGWAAIGGLTSVPYGWVDFCYRYKGECDAQASAPRDVQLTPTTFKEIERINRWVNKNVEATPDIEHWGVVDQWDYPTDGKGDCEDYALLKRKLLAEQGFPIQALLMTVVKDSANEGHAVLTVKTDHGDFVLDNLSDQVKPWKQTPYRFVKRQSQTDVSEWVSIGPPTPAPAYVSR
jgi:predicted transglutaminase-like cysteine proteinase